MKYNTTTGIGYFEDSEGRVVDRVGGVSPGSHTAGDPRVVFVEVESRDELPPTDPFYKPDPPEPDPGPTVEERLTDLETRLTALEDTLV